MPSDETPWHIAHQSQELFAVAPEGLEQKDGLPSHACTSEQQADRKFFFCVDVLCLLRIAERLLARVLAVEDLQTQDSVKSLLSHHGASHNGVIQTHWQSSARV